MYNFQRYVNYERSFTNAVKQFINIGYKRGGKYSDDWLVVKVRYLLFFAARFNSLILLY